MLEQMIYQTLLIKTGHPKKNNYCGSQVGLYPTVNSTFSIADRQSSEMPEELYPLDYNCL